MRMLQSVLTVALSVVVTSALQANQPPVVSSVQAQQIPGTGDVQITYDVSDADGDNVLVRVVCSADGGVTFILYASTIYEDPDDGIGTAVPPGTGKTILWNAAADYPGQYWSNVIAKVIATDGAGVGGKMVLVPAGEFTMGWTCCQSEAQPSHAVYLDAYYIDKYEVTNAEYQVFIDVGGYSTQGFWSQEGWEWRETNTITEPSEWGTGCNSGSGYPGFPVAGVSWYEAEAYANFVGKRLPTEAEWEKAARGTDPLGYPGRYYAWEGDDFDPYRGNWYGSNDPYEPCTTPVGFFDGRLHPGNPAFQTINSPGPYGTYDQSGNVLEWVADWHSSTYYQSSPTSNPRGPLGGGWKVIRGGSAHSWSWHIPFPSPSSQGLSTWWRFLNTPNIQIGYSCCAVRLAPIGFRCVRNAP